MLYFPLGSNSEKQQRHHESYKTANSSRNKFWCSITVLVIVLSLFIPFKQCTLLIQHKQHKTNASGFGLRTSFYLCCKCTNPLMQKYMSRTTGKSLSTLAFAYKPQNTGVFSCSILNRNRKREPSASCISQNTGHHGFDCRSYRGRSCRMQAC